MAAKAILALCASALFVQCAVSQCIGSLNPGIFGAGLGYGSNAGLAGGCGYSAPALGQSLYSGPAISATGGGLAISSASPISPSGISVVSENAIEGALEVGGQLPVLAAVGFESSVPSSGAAGVTYSCGNGNVGIASESLAAAGAELAGLNAGLRAANYGGIGLANAGLVGTGRIGLNGARGCGCGIY